ncbi:MAG: TonB-dependent receptor [Cryomorphaceae bacterium]|nr:TonB-dependent receptor [Cryomorphaceae bacterium]
MRNFLWLVVLVGLGLEGFAQKDRFRIFGVVTYDEVPIAGATVYLHELHRETKTDIHGFYSFENVKPGAYHLHVTHKGYMGIRHDFHVYDEDVKINFPMEKSAFDMDQVVVETNPFKSGPVQQTLTVEVVDRKFLEKNSTETFVNALERVPGISSINTGVGVAKPVIRGMSFNRVMVNDRGIKQEGQQWGADHGLEIDPFDVDRVEVIKGPASLMYGSDAMGGVINIQPGPMPSNNEIRAHVVSGFRTNNEGLFQTAMVEGSEKDYFFKARFTAQDFGNYRVPADDFVYAGYRLPINENSLKNTAGRERHFSLMGGKRTSWGFSKLTMSRFYQEVGLFPGAVGIPTAYGLQHRGEFRNIELPSQENEHIKVISNSNILLGKNWMEIDLGYQRNLRRELSAPHAHGQEPRAEGNLAMELMLHTLTANARLHHIVNGKFKSIFGLQGQYMIHDYQGFEFLVPAYSSFQGGVFYFNEYRWKPNLTVNAGLRVDGAFHEIQEHLQPLYRNFQPTGEFTQRNPDVQRSFMNASGSAGLSWVLKEKFNLKLNLGSSYRIPTPVELSINGVHHGNFRHEVGNPNLDSERGWQSDLNLTLKEKHFIASITPFASFYDNYLYLAPTGRFSELPGPGALWEYRQNRAWFAGFESMVNWRLGKNIQFSTGFEYVRNKNLDTRLPLPLTPPMSIIYDLEYSGKSRFKWLDKWEASIDTRWVSGQNRTDRNERATDGYVLLGASVGGVFLLGKQEVHLHLRGMNLTDAFYFNHLSRYRLLNLPEQGRNINIHLKLPFALRKAKN